jgi:hypothetical protein
MSELSRKRSLLAATFTILFAPALLAGYPSPRFESRMVYDAANHRLILFGGSTAVDRGTKLSYDLADTWKFVNTRWIELSTKNAPLGRRGHAMVYDAARNQVVVFGGRNKTTDLNDTWVFRNDDWTQLSPANSPTVRVIPGADYDLDRGRILLFGGTQLSSDSKTSTPLYDTWEFDGTNWKQVSPDGPHVTKPILAYDAARKQMVMLALNDKSVTAMYTWDPSKGAWNQATPTLLPPCVNEGSLVFQTSNNTLLYTGGVCADSTNVDETYEWDGTNWTKVTLSLGNNRTFGSAYAFDTDRHLAYLFGGTPVFGGPLGSTLTYANAIWLEITDPFIPAPRSLFAFNTDPVNGAITMFAGVNDLTTFNDFWLYHNGQWLAVIADGSPATCLDPNAAYDSDRGKLVTVCADASTFEWDPAAGSWKQFTGLKTAPPPRQFSSMVYDQTLKKTVLFGGFDTNYLDQTWTWDGAAWTRVKNSPAPSRALASLWYDPKMKKTVMYGGLGRLTSQDRITRFSDMWTFDGTGWTELKPSGTTPGARYGALTAVIPKLRREKSPLLAREGNVILFGGLRLDTVNNLQEQVYASDQWEWDGSAQTWTKVTTPTVPPARENGGIAYDPARDELVMFGGYAGQYFSDAWSYDGTDWTVRTLPDLTRRRAARPGK